MGMEMPPYAVTVLGKGQAGQGEDTKKYVIH